MRWAVQCFWAAVLFTVSTSQLYGQSGDIALTLDKKRYAPGEEIVVTTSCPGPTTSAWIGLFEAGASSQSYLTYEYISSDENCRLVFDGQDDPGQYEARFFPDSGYDDQLSVAFEVGEGASGDEGGATATSADNAQSTTTEATEGGAYVTDSGIVFDKERYQTGETIRITTDCSLYEPDGWIGIFNPSDAVGDYGTYQADWLYFRDQDNCRFEFAGRAFPGEYEVRIVPPHGDFIAVRQIFEVLEGGAASTITLGKPDYSTWEAIEVTTACPPEADAHSDWIALFPAGESSYSYGTQGEDWFYMGDGAQDGSNCTYVFSPRTETGLYEIRQFHDTDYTAYAQLGFDIATTGVQPEPEAVAEAEPGLQMPLQIALPKSGFAVGEPIAVTVQCHQKEYPAVDPWIGLRKLSEPLHSHPQRSEAGTFQEDWHYLKNYTQPGGDCVYGFAGRAEPGTYEVRVFRTLEDCDCPDNLAGRLTFTVGDGAESSAGMAISADIMLTEAANRHTQYDYVRAHSSDCIVLDLENAAFTNACDFPVSVYFTRKLGYEDAAMQYVEAMASQSTENLSFDDEGTVSWLACHESQELCSRALTCIKDKHDAGETVLGYLTAECSAFEK